jgi:hypothetical protein
MSTTNTSPTQSDNTVCSPSLPSTPLLPPAHPIVHGAGKCPVTGASFTPPKPVTVVKPIKPKPSWLLVYLCFVRQTDGRDKAMKLVQYSIKLVLWLALHQPRQTGLRKRFSALASALSTTRKVIRLGHWMESIQELIEWYKERPKASSHIRRWLLDSLPPLVAFFNDIFDDIYCLCRIKCLPKPLEGPAERYANWCWFTSTLIDLYSNAKSQWKIQADIRAQRQLLKSGSIQSDEQEIIKTKLATLQDKAYWLRVTGGKLLCDLGFCSYDIFHWQFSDGWQASTGFLSGALSAHKLWVKTVESC